MEGRTRGAEGREPGGGGMERRQDAIGRGGGGDSIHTYIRRTVRVESGGGDWFGGSGWARSNSLLAVGKKDGCW